MSYRLDLNAELPAAARLAAREQLENGAEVLRERQAEDPVAAVHTARKNVKKTRALLRLVRPGLDKETYRRENRTLRDAARTVAHVRDADVMVETIDALHDRFAGQLPAAVFERVRGDLDDDARSSREATGDDLGVELVEALQAVGGRVGEWPLEDARWSVTRKGIRRAYRRGRKAFALADADPTTDSLHEWRKRVKDLWYHERLLKPVWPAVFGAQADEAHTLADLLGDEHDLAVLAERLRENPPTDDIEEVLELIEQRRGELLAHVRALGRRVYAEKPKPFARRVKRYFASAEAADPVPG
jgi:CHAD domain-containing protein